MLSKKTLLILFALFVILFVIGHTFYPKTPSPQVIPEVTQEVTIAEKTFSIEIADTDATREKGLSGHAPLLDNQGMLFVFPRPDNYGFWMRDMLFPIDIIWIDSSSRIAHIEKSVATSTYPKVFYPDSLSRYVLEVSAGQSEALNLKIGDVVKFIKK